MLSRRKFFSIGMGLLAVAAQTRVSFGGLFRRRKKGVNRSSRLTAPTASVQTFSSSYPSDTSTESDPIDSTQTGNFNRFKIKVHTARKGSGGTDYAVCLFATLKRSDGTLYNNLWHEMPPAGDGGISLEQGAWDEFEYEESFPQSDRIVSWSMRLGAPYNQRQKWSYDEMYFYGRTPSGSWTKVGGVNHGAGYKTVDSFNGDTEISPVAHTVTSDGGTHP